MGVNDGQAVNQAVTNPAFLDANADDVALCKIGFNDPDVSLVSGSAVTNIQREQNAIWSFLGGALNQVKNTLPSWATTYFGNTNDTVKQRVEAIDAAMVHRSGIDQLNNGVSSHSVTFTSPMPDANYVVSVIFACPDPNPTFFSFYLSAQSAGGFTIVMNAPTDSTLYFLHYSARVGL